VCLQPLNEIFDGREVLGLQGVVTDVDGNYHGFAFEWLQRAIIY
jgi:hypothetical protein